MSMSNMNAVLFFTAIFPQFIDADAPIAPQVALLYITFCACWLFAFMSYATLGALMRDYVRNSSTIRWLHLLSGTVYFAAAGMLGSDDDSAYITGKTARHDPIGGGSCDSIRVVRRVRWRPRKIRSKPSRPWAKRLGGRFVLERFPVRWNRVRFHLTGNARTGVSCCSRHIPFGWFQPNGICS